MEQLLDELTCWTPETGGYQLAVVCPTCRTPVGEARRTEGWVGWAAYDKFRRWRLGGVSRREAVRLLATAHLRHHPNCRRKVAA